MNLIGQLMMVDRSHSKLVTAQERKICKINLFRNAVSGLFTIKELSAALGYHEAYVSKRVRYFEKKGLARCAGKKKTEGWVKPPFLWEWV